MTSYTSSAVLLTVVLPAFAAVLGLAVGRRSRALAVEVAVLGALIAAGAAVAELVGVTRGGPIEGVPFLGIVDTGSVRIGLDLRADSLSAVVAIAVGVVASCVQIYSAGYLAGPGTPDAPTRYAPYAASVSLFTAAMMLVVHADDLVLLLVGWEIMGLCSYLLVGHHSEREAARQAAVKAFLVTRAGDLGVLLAVVVLVVQAGTTSISGLLQLASAGRLGAGTLGTACLLLLAGVAGKSAQFPLHTWLPDAMEGPTPVSALIHAATMVAAGVFLVARLLPLFLAAQAAGVGVLDVAAVIAAVTMLGAALAAVAQEDLKRLLAWSTISQVAYMLAGVAVARKAADAAPGVFHLLSHAAFKALLFLAAGCVAHLLGSTRLADLGGLRRSHPGLAWLLGLGLLGLAGIPPLGGFWSKEAVLTAAEHEAIAAGSWSAGVVLVAGLATAVITGVYAGRAWSLVALGDEPDAAEVAGHGRLPRSMTVPLVVLAVPTVLLGLVMLAPPAALAGVRVSATTALTGGFLSIAGVGWALTAPRLGVRDVADALPARVRDFLLHGYRLDAVQSRLVTRPAVRLARAVASGDSDVVDAYARGVAHAARWGGVALRRAQAGLATAYVGWAVAGAVVVGVAGMVLS